MEEVTGDYKGLQRITRGYRGLQGVTESYKGLQGVTRGYRGLQGVSAGYKGLQRGYRKTWFLARTSKDTLSSFTLKKRFKVEDINFLDENDGVTPLEKGKCCVFH